MTPLHSLLEWSKRHPFFWALMGLFVVWAVASLCIWALTLPGTWVGGYNSFGQTGIPEVGAVIFSIASLVLPPIILWRYEVAVIKEREERPQRLAAMEKELGLGE